jgi:hypothetical protein
MLTGGSKEYPQRIADGWSATRKFSHPSVTALRGRNHANGDNRRGAEVKFITPTAGTDDRTDDCFCGADDVALPGGRFRKILSLMIAETSPNSQGSRIFNLFSDLAVKRGTAHIAADPDAPLFRTATREAAPFLKYENRPILQAIFAGTFGKYCYSATSHNTQPIKEISDRTSTLFRFAKCAVCSPFSLSVFICVYLRLIFLPSAP